jgi:hypothetical protein
LDGNALLNHLRATILPVRVLARVLAQVPVKVLVKNLFRRQHNYPLDSCIEDRLSMICLDRKYYHNHRRTILVLRSPGKCNCARSANQAYLHPVKVPAQALAMVRVDRHPCCMQ